MKRTKRNAKKTSKPEVMYGYCWNDEREVNMTGNKVGEAIEEGRDMIEDGMSSSDDDDYIIVYKMVPVAVIRRSATVVEKF